MADGKLQEVQLARLGRLLQNTKNERQARILEKQLAALQAEHRKAPKPEAAILPAQVSSALDKLGDLFGWWQRVLMPNFTPRLVQDPPPSLGEGGIGADVFKGSLSLNGHTFSHGAHEQWWVRTWQSTVPFPTTPPNYSHSASLAYRFSLGAGASFYFQPAIGSFAIYVTVAKTSDLAAQPIDFSHPASSQFAIFTDLPLTAVPPLVFGGATVKGTIPLVPGKTPAIGILVGMILGARGETYITPGQYSNVSIAPPGATELTDLGLIEYRRDRAFWVDAVAEMFR
jgi:hypothetical protein